MKKQLAQVLNDFQLVLFWMDEVPHASGKLPRSSGQVRFVERQVKCEVKP